MATPTSSTIARAEMRIAEHIARDLVSALLDGKTGKKRVRALYRILGKGERLAAAARTYENVYVIRGASPRWVQDTAKEEMAEEARIIQRIAADLLIDVADKELER